MGEREEQMTKRAAVYARYSSEEQTGGGMPPLMYPHPELGCGFGERLGDRFRYGWTIA